MQLNLTGRSVLVLDGSAPAAVTVSALLHRRALVTVAAPAVCAALEDLALRGRLTWVTTPVDESRFDVVLRTVAPSEAGAPAAVRTAGHVTLVGAGPGDPGLVTVAGRAAVKQADVILTDRLAPWEALKWARPDAEIIDVTKIPYGRSTSQEQINALLVEHARAGRHVVRFKGGDSYVFGRGFEEVTACAEAGVPTTVIPGVTSSIAAPELAGIPVTHRGLVQGFTVISGHVPPGHPDSSIDYAALARTGTTLVVLMGMRNLAAIADALVAAGLDRNTPCAVVADAASAGQRVLRSTLADVVADTAEAGIGAPAVTVIGHVVALGPAAVQAVATASRCSDT
ncbi:MULTISPECIES: uroporphyrinogen-III C-methyltransferase [Micromonospora]|uniref:uroporphyrinogen-III C-methyltransferase n=1 Tax=Micromonospora chalcea TaxID=1874 RepID=A0ABX9XZL3_MICCH|nr:MULTISPECIES: uroporphyrinogen-III C-methyltransferase [Micromonospora]MBP1781923.1 uroporphyrin-III C-methyltransferase [Micromonospora sp. HB375]MDH6471281.1 uroporphyrin-III C-methyltransferase [Micromonospora sp. H404/HB375]ODB78242.1 uroporphyrinogen-III C-methyltransferase [Micromonospora sp. II]OKJ46084.1 uroporphyrin-III methyltransferase [Micromonospora sp. TSRI0369]RQW87565.1 uroporphyrinogen-III C-methyltransferase [Micromonospora chalcea]